MLIAANFESSIPDSSSTPSPPDEMSAQLMISVNGLDVTAGHLMSIPLQAIVGVARLHVPRALQVGVGSIDE